MSPQTAVNPIHCDATEVTISADASTGKAVDIRRMRADDLPQVQLIDQLSFSLPWPANAYRYELKENPSSLQWVASAPVDSLEGQAGSYVRGREVPWWASRGVAGARGGTG